MSVKVMGLVWDARLPRPEKFVLMAYADHAEHDGSNVYPSIGLISWKTGYDERQVQRITRSLVSLNILRSKGISRLGTNNYSIDLNKLRSYISEEIPAEKRQVVTENGGDILTPQNGGGVTFMQNEGDILSEGGDIAMSYDPSFKPSFNPSERDSWNIFLFAFASSKRTSVEEEQSIKRQCQIYCSRTWLETEEEDRWVIACPDETVLEWMRQRLQRTMERDLVGYLARPISLEFILSEQPELVEEPA